MYKRQANIFSVGVLAEKGVKCDLLSTPPVLHHGTNYFPISTEVPRMSTLSWMIWTGQPKPFHEGRRTCGIGGWATATRALSNSRQTMTIWASSSTGRSSQATSRYALSRTVRKAATPHLIVPAPRHGLRGSTKISLDLIVMKRL